MSTPNLSRISDKNLSKFWKRASAGAPNECWPWIGGRNGQGYGEVWIDGAKVRASHISWMIHHGNPIPAGMFVCHKCDNPPCVNPAHLFIGTHRDNMLDMTIKGRVKTRLNAASVREIREMRKDGISLRAIGLAFNVGHNTVRRAATGINWKHVA